jgi:hypothetical protein
VTALTKEGGACYDGSETAAATVYISLELRELRGNAEVMARRIRDASVQEKEG